MAADKKKILFVCLGNVCRSPIAEAVFLDAIRRANVEDEWEVDSAAIADWHVGLSPDNRAWNVMRKYNLEYNLNNRARQITEDDFRRFDYIMAMDRGNIHDLTDTAPEDAKAKVHMLGKFNPGGVKEIRDPYCDASGEGYENAYVESRRFCEYFLQQFYGNDRIFSD